MDQNNAPIPKFQGTVPDLPRRLFWEYRYESIDWQKHSRMVIQRVLDWGMDQEIDALIRFYGFERVKNELWNHPMYLMEISLDRACRIFGVKKEDTVCYKRKVERGFGWI
jgi:hypothetical protein